MAFFKRGASKRRAPMPKKKTKKSTESTEKQKKRPTDDVEISSDSDAVDAADLSDGEVYEDAEAKSSREARRVLEKLKANEEVDEADEDFDTISHPLKRDAIHQTTKSLRRIADQLVIDDEVLANYRPHRFSPVCLTISNDSRYVVSCSKDGSIVKYDLKANQKVGSILHRKGNPNSHVGQVRAVAISSDDRYLASGGDDKVVRIWTLDSLKHVKDFPGHRGPVTSLVFRHASNDLYSGSADKSVRSWNLDQMGFVEILFGHSEPITQLDMLSKPRLLSGGGSARTIHLFKIEQSSQLLFNGLNDCISIDTVAMLNDDHYVSGQIDGSIYVWSVFKKKPVCVLRNAHGLHEDGQSRWITSVAALPFSDLVASGSSDGKFKLWKVSENYKNLILDGFINDIRFAADGRTVALAVGQEHRAGRWWTCREARNSVVVLRLRSTTEFPSLISGDVENMDGAESS